MQASLTEVKASTSGRHASENRNVTPKSNGLARSGSGHTTLAEGAETALLYVRFRAAAEPGLKGASFCSIKPNHRGNSAADTSPT